MRAALIALLLVSAPLAAAQPLAGTFTIAGKRFAPDVILDARAQPSLDGSAAILITFSPEGAKQLADLTRANIGKSVAIALDGKTLISTSVQQPAEAGLVEVTGPFTVAEAEAIAKRISGKDPLPDELSE
jgi:preprotein translocase subunit SecD